MPSSHLPRTPCEKMSTIFRAIFGASYGYGLRHMCSHSLRASCDFFYGASGQPGVNPYKDCAEIVRKSCSVSAVAVQSPQPPHGNHTKPGGDRPSHGARAGIVQCHPRHVYGLRFDDF